MKLINQLILCFTVLLFPHYSWSTQCDKPDSAEEARVYFLNGRGATDQSKIYRNRDKLKSVLGNSDLWGDEIGATRALISNKTLDWFRVYKQRNNDPSQFWEWVANISIAPQWFQDIYIDYVTDLSNASYSNSADIRRMVAESLQDFRSGKKVVLIAHSQGNYFANMTYQYIKDNYPQYQNSIGIVAVGSYASRVQDGGFHTNNTLDNAIRLVDLFYSVLPYNETYDQPNNNENHAFIETYLTAFGGRIKGHVIATVNRLTSPPKHPDCVEVAVATRSATNIKENSARMQGYMSRGNKSDAWFNFRKGSNSVATCKSNSSNYNGTGNYNSGSSLYSNLSGLTASTTYYYRACAKGKSGDVAQGAIRSFKTKGTPPPPPPPPAEPAQIRLLDIVELGSPSNFRYPSLKVRITKGINIDAWGYIHDASIRLPSCSRDAGNFDGKGKYSRNEDTGSGINGIYRITPPGNLPRDKIYVAKVCAKSTVGKVYDSGILYFSTDAYGQNARCRPAASTCR